MLLAVLEHERQIRHVVQCVARMRTLEELRENVDPTAMKMVVNATNRADVVDILKRAAREGNLAAWQFIVVDHGAHVDDFDIPLFVDEAPSELLVSLCTHNILSRGQQDHC